MKDLLTHPITDQQLQGFIAEPGQVLLLVGPTGTGKRTLAERLAEDILELPSNSFSSYEHALVIRPVDAKSIGIEAARQIEQFLRLRVPSQKKYNRAIIIENGHLMTIEAQNALLKTLEEPPTGTIIIITVAHRLALLPTVRSRTQAINIHHPKREIVEDFFAKQGHDKQATSRAYALSGGLVGLTYALLEDQTHPLALATEQAKKLLSQPVYERLISIDSLAKDKDLAIDTVDVLQRMARLSLQTASGQTARKWQAILEASYYAAEALAANGQPKLVLTKLVLQF